jgi:hypothetical protein
MSNFWPQNAFWPRDDVRNYWLYRIDNATRKYERFGPYKAVRATLQGNAAYGDIGISDVAEERVNLPMDSLVGQDDRLLCVEDGQVWAVKFVRRQANFRVAYLQRGTLAQGRASV